MKINLIAGLVITILCYLVLPFVLLCIKNKKAKNIALISAFSCFLVILFVGVFGKIDITPSYVEISFVSTGEWCAKAFSFSFSNFTTFDIVTNLLMLIPIGFFVYYFVQSKKWWQKTLLLLLIGLCCGIIIEVCQFIFPIQRSAQLSDIIFNTISVLLGGLLCSLYIKIITSLQHKQNK